MRKRSQSEKSRVAARRSLRLCALAAAVSCPIWNVASTRALTINLTAPATMSPLALAGFRAAADRWQANFTDNVTVSLNINFQALAPNVLGSTSTSRSTSTITTVRGSMTTDATSADDTAAVGSLPSGSTVPRIINYTSNNPNGSASLTPYLQSTGVSTISLAKPNARALGISTTGGTDATIVFSNQFSFDFNPKDGLDFNTIDFVAVAAHEIGHALGFSSSVDTLDVSAGTFNDASLSISTMDLFRYSTLSASTAGGVIDFAADARDKYFSLNRGATKIASFAKGVNHGDGDQASHWLDGAGLGLMDPSISSNVIGEISELDRRMFDVIGWNRNFTWHWAGDSNSFFAWDDALRWDTDGVPDARMNAVFNQAGTFGVFVFSNSAAKSLAISSASVSMIISNSTMTIGNTSAPAVTLDSGAALTITGGTFITSLGTASAGTTGGNMHIAGGSQLSLNAGALLVSGALLAGGSGTGPATISFNSGTVSIGTAAGTDHNFYVGQANSARVNHADGVQATVAGNLLLAPLSAAGTAQYEMAGGTLVVGGGLGIGGTMAAATAGAATFAARGNATVNIAGTTHLYANSKLILDNNARISTNVLDIPGGQVLMTSNGAKTLRTTSLSISVNGGIDLSNNTLVVDYTSPASPFNAVFSMVQSGYHNGAWDGAGIRSSSAAGNTLFGIGVVEASDIGSPSTFAGVSIDTTSLLVDYTFLGDSNLDGAVDIRDLYALASHWQSGSARWVNGDFDYNGTVDARDLTLLSANWQAGVASVSAASLASILNVLGLPEVSVPEPASVLLISAALATLLRRRGRTQA